MTSQEFRRLVDIIETKFYELQNQVMSTMDPNWQGHKVQKWKKLLDDLGIEYIDRWCATLEQQRAVEPHQVTTNTTDEVRVIDPDGNILRLTQDQVKKILVIGL